MTTDVARSHHSLSATPAGSSAEKQTLGVSASLGARSRPISAVARSAAFHPGQLYGLAAGSLVSGPRIGFLRRCGIRPEGLRRPGAGSDRGTIEIEILATGAPMRITARWTQRADCGRLRVLAEGRRD